MAYLRFLLIIIKAPGLTVPVDGQCGSSCGGGPKCYSFLNEALQATGVKRTALDCAISTCSPIASHCQEQCYAFGQPTLNPSTPKSFSKDFLNATDTLQRS